MFKQNMDSHVYCSIIYRYLYPFMAEHDDKICFLHQDNDTKHNSKLCRLALEQRNIEWVIRI